MPDHGARQLGVRVHTQLVGDGEQQGVGGPHSGVGGQFLGDGIGGGLTSRRGVDLQRGAVIQLGDSAAAARGTHLDLCPANLARVTSVLWNT